MRRVFALAALSGALFATAACGSGGTGSPTAAPTSAKPDYSAGTKAACTELKTAFSAEPSQAEITKAVQEAVKGKTTKAEINAATLAAVKSVLGAYVGKIKDVAAKADDPTLKENLLAVEAEMQTAIEGLTSLDEDIDKKLSAVDEHAASKKVTELCTAVGVTLE